MNGSRGLALGEIAPCYCPTRGNAPGGLYETLVSDQTRESEGREENMGDESARGWEMNPHAKLGGAEKKGGPILALFGKSICRTIFWAQVAAHGERQGKERRALYTFDEARRLRVRFCAL